MKKDNKNDIGCIVLIIIFLISNLIYFFANTDSNEFAEMGSSIVFIAIAAGLWYLISRLNTEGKKGWILPIILVIGGLLLFGFLSQNFSLLYGLGIIAVVIITIIIGVLIYNSSHDD